MCVYLPQFPLEYSVSGEFEADRGDSEVDLERAAVVVDGDEGTVVRVHHLVVDATQLLPVLARLGRRETDWAQRSMYILFQAAPLRMLYAYVNSPTGRSRGTRHFGDIMVTVSVANCQNWRRSRL